MVYTFKKEEGTRKNFLSVEKKKGNGERGGCDAKLMVGQLENS